MSRLLREIKQQDKDAAAVLEQEGLLTDSDIQTLTREELNELFAGRGNLKLRRTIFEIIHKQKPVDQVLKELKEFIPHESLRDSLTNDGVLVDYLRILKDMKTQMNHVQSFLDAHICLLEEFSTNQPDQQSATCGPDPVSHYGQPGRRQQGAPGTSTSATDDPMESHNGPTDCGPQGARGTSTSATDDPEEFPNVQTDGGPQGARDSYSGTGTSGAGGQTMFLTGQTGTSTSATNDPMDSDNGQTDCGPQGARGTSTSATGGPMESLNGQTDVGSQRAPEAELLTDSDIQTLTREELNELFVGCGNLKLRRTIFEIIHKQKPVDQVLKELKEFIPSESFRDALTNNVVLADYLPILKTQVNHVQSFLDAHVSILEEFSTNQPNQQSATCGPDPESHNGQPDGRQQGAPAKLKYRVVVSGNTFGAHLNLMQRVKDQVQNQLQLDESSQDHEITFLFRPICSRIESDVKAAMTDVKVSSDDKPVILVLMHHTREFKFTSPLQTWRYDNKVVLYVHVFYHETMQGLLKCEENNDAVAKIQNELLKHFIPRSIDSRGKPQGVGAGGLTGNTSGRGGGNYRGSDVGSSSSGRSRWSPAWWRSDYS